MSGIYIPGMEMPTSCCECFAFKSNADGYLFCKAKRISFGKEDAEWLPLKTPNWCPLVPVPEHGRLGDLDELLDRAFGCLDEETFLAFQFLVNGSVTIIPSGKEGEG